MSIAEVIISLFKLGIQLANLFGEDLDELRRTATEEAGRDSFPSDAVWKRWIEMQNG